MDVGVLELSAVVPFVEHFGGRLDADAADGLAAGGGAGLAAVEVADGFARVDVGEVGAFFEVVEGVEGWGLLVGWS